MKIVEHGVLTRCAWVGEEPLYLAYHDQEWGVPVHDDRLLFEFLVLEGAQAGLSWLTILRKREGYRGRSPVSTRRRWRRFGRSDIERLLGDPGIVRNRLKVESAVAQRTRVPARAGGVRQLRRLRLGIRRR